jgi:23S rRNA (cytosine1962-C5)-methyltransferase
LAYRRLTEAALGLLEPDGLLVTASCSFHMSAEHLLETVQRAARHHDRHLQLLESGQQGPDHPVHPAIPETAYLKAFFLRVLPTL